MGLPKLSRTAYNQAKDFIDKGEFVIDERDDWSEHQPTAEQENRFIRNNGIIAYGRWHLGVDSTKPRHSRSRYKFPYGDLKKVHRCGVMAAEVRAGQYKCADIERAASHLHGMIDNARSSK